MQKAVFDIVSLGPEIQVFRVSTFRGHVQVVTMLAGLASPVAYVTLVT